MEKRTEKLFYMDQYIKEFECNIIDIIEKEDEYHVILDKTAFFPGGGGQQGDLGLLDDKKVVNVYEENGEIYHVLSEKPKKDSSIKGEIDWNRRIDGMQQHLAQHILSGCFFSLFSANTVSVHIGSEISTVDIIGYLNQEQIYEAEKMANKAISDRLRVEMLTPSKQDLKKMKLRRDLPKSSGEIRVVRIEGLDVNACCGVHPSNTLDLQFIKIKRWEKHKGNTRIEYLSGSRAVKDALQNEKILTEACRLLSSGENDIVNSIKNLLENLRVSNEECKKLKVEVSKYELEELVKSGINIGNLKVITKVYSKENMRYLNRLASDLTREDNRVVLFALNEGDKCSLLFASSKNIKKIKMNELLRDSITLVDGRGGGSEFLAQGGGKNVNNIGAVIDYSIRRISDLNK